MVCKVSVDVCTKAKMSQLYVSTAHVMIYMRVHVTAHTQYEITVIDTMEEWNEN